MFFLPEGYSIAKILIILNALLAMVVVFFERKKPESTFTWLLLLLFLPVFGFILYLLVGQDLHKKRIFRLKATEEALILRSTREQYVKIKNDLIPFNEPAVSTQKDTILLNIKSTALITQDNAIKLFHDGLDLFKDFREKLESAQHYIYLQSYIFRDDQLGKEIIEVLTRKAQAGVEVKLLFDGMGCLRLKQESLKPLLAAGGKIAEFYPPFQPYITTRINYRNHRKIMVVDGKYGYLGGFNIGDEYIHRDKKIGFWRDTHLRIQGSAVQDLAMRFWLDWSYTYGETEKKLPHTDFQHLPVPGNTAMQIVSSGPDSPRSNVLDAFLKIIYNTRRTLFMQTPYFVPNDSLLSALKLAALSGVDVHLMIPARPDHKFLFWAAHSYLGELLDCGARVYLYKNGFLHSKTLIADSFASSVGSTNLDIRSFQLNFEINAFVYDRAIALDLEKQFVEDVRFSAELTMQDYENRSWKIRFLESFFRLFSPLL